MFCRELRNACWIIGVGLPQEVENINSGKIKIRRGKDTLEIFGVKTITTDEFAAAIENESPDFVWLATRNPVDKVVEFYYKNFAGKDNPPVLILSQNGLSVIDDARRGLVAAMGHGADKVEIIRVSLVNGIDLRIDESSSREAVADQSGRSVIRYKLPIKLGFGAVGKDLKSECKFGKVAPQRVHLGTTLKCESSAIENVVDDKISDLAVVFQKAGIRAQKFVGDEVLKMENSKLFLNLIGMMCAIENVPVDEGWRDKEIFKKEIAMLREFVLAVKKSGEGFVGNLGGYPVDFFAKLTLLPVWLILPFRGMSARVIAKGRNRPKDLSEIDYYNGEVLRLGKRVGAATPINREIIQKSKESKSNYK